jgi:hypothetical protein
VESLEWVFWGTREREREKWAFWFHIINVHRPMLYEFLIVLTADRERKKAKNSKNENNEARSSSLENVEHEIIKILDCAHSNYNNE